MITRSDRRVHEDKLCIEESQNQLAQVVCEIDLLKNVFHFKYLGSIRMFATDDD